MTPLDYIDPRDPYMLIVGYVVVQFLVVFGWSWNATRCKGRHARR